MTRRQAAGFAVVLAATALVGAKYLRAANDAIAVGRDGACRALTPDPVPAALRNREAPDFELADTTGKKWSLRSLRGRPVLLHFWATWCPPCVEESPSIEQLARNLGDDAVVLAVSADEGWDPIRKFFAAGTSLSVMLDETRATPKLYGTEKFPESFLIDRAGNVRQYFISTRKWDTAEALACIESVR